MRQNLKMIAELVVLLALTGCAGRQAAETPAAGETFICPIDGMEMEVSKAVDSVEYGGKTYHFCMEGEKEEFLANPQKYVSEP